MSKHPRRGGPEVCGEWIWREWSGRADLNRGPPAPKAGALPGCATPRLSSIINELPDMTLVTLPNRVRGLGGANRI